MIYFLLNFYLLSACIFPGEQIKEVDYPAMLRRAERATALEITKRYNFVCTSNSAEAMCLVRRSFLFFRGQTPITVDEARKLAIECCETYQSYLNSYRELRPYFFEYPFPAARLGFNYDLDNSYLVNHPELPLAGVSVISGRIIYYKNPRKGFPGDCTEEPYEVARKIVMEEQKKAEIFMPTKVPSGIVYKKPDADYYTGPLYERKMCWEVDRYARKVAKQAQMQFHRVDDFSDSQEVVYGLTFFSSHEKNLDEAKVFARQLVTDYLTFLRGSEVVLEYQKENTKYQRSKHYPVFTSDEIVPYQLGVKIGCWDKDYNRPKSPHIAEIVFMEGKFRYYEADPETEALKLVFEEPFSEIETKENGQQ